jgi:hypothetical protein
VRTMNSLITGAIRRYLHAARHTVDKVSHEASLLRLKQIGFEPAIIYDLGAHRGDWTREASRVYPNAQYFLFEANSDHVEYLRQTGHKYFISALGSDDLQGKPFYLPKEGTSLGASFLITEVSLVNYNKGAPLFADVVSWITERGFFCVDICGYHRWKHDCVFQMDLLFVRAPIFSKYASLGF